MILCRDVCTRRYLMSAEHEFSIRCEGQISGSGPGVEPSLRRTCHLQSYHCGECVGRYVVAVSHCMQRPGMQPSSRDTGGSAGRAPAQIGTQRHIRCQRTASKCRCSYMVLPLAPVSWDQGGMLRFFPFQSSRLVVMQLCYQHPSIITCIKARLTEVKVYLGCSVNSFRSE